MDNKIEIPDLVEITRKAEFVTFLNFIKDAVSKNQLKQYWDADNKFASTGLVEELGKNGTFPDCIEMYFYSNQTNKKYKLEVETYHGSGGEWSVI